LFITAETLTLCLLVLWPTYMSVSLRKISSQLLKTNARNSISAVVPPRTPPVSYLQCSSKP